MMKAHILKAAFRKVTRCGKDADGLNQQFLITISDWSKHPDMTRYNGLEICNSCKRGLSGLKLDRSRGMSHPTINTYKRGKNGNPVLASTIDVKDHTAGKKARKVNNMG